MRVCFESTFDLLYLVLIIGMGLVLCIKATSKGMRLFGIMALVLGIGDSFHLVPRVIALVSGSDMEIYATPLGIGKFVTSITMTVFYIILYYIYRDRYKLQGQKGLTLAMFLLAATRIALCLFPQNEWLSYHQPVSWGIYRNLPFLVMGIIVIVLFYRASRQHNDKPYKYMWLTIVLSFGFYLPVVLWGSVHEIVGLLMIPKTMAYVWTVLIGYLDYMKGNRLQ